MQKQFQCRNSSPVIDAQDDDKADLERSLQACCPSTTGQWIGGIYLCKLLSGELESFINESCKLVIQVLPLLVNIKHILIKEK